MKMHISYIAVALAIQVILPACRNADTDQVPKAVMPPIRTKVLNAADQQGTPPDKVLQSLIEGNRNYRNNQLTSMDDTLMMRETAQGQYPEAFILACIDSRVPVEKVFDKGIGDLFVGRVAGNIVDADMLGSMEYGCKVAGARLIVVLGHEACGAVKAAADGEELGNITGLLARIKPALQQSQGIPGDHNSKNPAFIAAVAQHNIRNSIQEIKTRSPVLNEMVNKGEIKIVGAYYHLATGEVTFFDD
jgi:carbonic anhydrase